MSHETQKDSTAVLALAALGVVYGDIGTSPLYALKEVFGNAHHPVPITPENVLGILSLVFWSLIVVVSFKYVTLIMRADNKGRGRHHGADGAVGCDEGNYRPHAAGGHPARAVRRRAVLRRRRDHAGHLGALGRGGAGGGTPAFAPFIVPITLGMLVRRCSRSSRHGTAKVGVACSGRSPASGSARWPPRRRIIASHPGVLAARCPGMRLAFLVADPAARLLSLGAASSWWSPGAEALYADMGHFGRRPIRLAWFGLVLPALLLNYFGQGACC
jgi:KUP system potassium uptake protein